MLFLIDNGADFNISDDQGLKPLHLAYALCDIELLKELIKREASLNDMNDLSWQLNALHWACHCNIYNTKSQLNLIKFLIEEQHMDIINTVEPMLVMGVQFLCTVL